MRKLIILFYLFVCSMGFCQVSTNKIQNTATLMLTNSTLYVGGSNVVFNGTRYLQGDIVSIYGIDGVIRFGPVTPIHDRMLLSWYTNDNFAAAANSWNLGPDFTAGSFHTFGVQDAFNSRVPFLINSNQNILLNIPFTIASSNLVVSNTVTTVSTNNAMFYMVKGFPGRSGSYTNVGVGETNVLVYDSGLLTNDFKIIP